ncbi:hypothetical protein O9992_30420 [Vibrio lentus]|nr:hypothetical protein [Vibrio lentus]
MARQQAVNHSVFTFLNRVSSRAYQVTANSMFIGKSVVELEEAFNADLTIEAIHRIQRKYRFHFRYCKQPYSAACIKASYLTGLTQAFPK